MDGGGRRILCRLGPCLLQCLQNNNFERALSECEVLMVRLGLLGQVLLGPLDCDTLLQPRPVLTISTWRQQRLGELKSVSLQTVPKSIQDVSSTAEHTIGLLLALLRRTPAAVGSVLAR